MATITATFKSDYSESRGWVIYDIAVDPNAPQQIFQGYLGPNDSTGPLNMYSSDGIYGTAMYQRTDGSPTRVDVSDQSTISMD
jgi:hypothetical protein